MQPQMDVNGVTQRFSAFFLLIEVHLIYNAVNSAV